MIILILYRSKNNGNLKMISEDEFKALKENQKIMHSDNKKEGICNNFYKPIEKVAWFSSNSIQHPLQTTKNNTNTICSYSIDQSYDYLTTTYLRVQTGEWRVKPDYIGKVKICLTRNYGYNLIKNATMYLNGSVDMDSFDNVSCEVYFGFNQIKGCGFRSSHERRIGNLKKLREWERSSSK